MDIFEHPGNLGSTRGTLFTVHHADWPAYPEGEDFRMALLQLTAFPSGTEFQVVDDIDRSLLLIADVPCGAPDKPFDPCNFHIAVWYEDLLDMSKRGFITGVEGITEKEWHSQSWAKLRSGLPPGAELGLQDPVTKNFRALDEPSFENYEDDEDWADQFVAHDGRVRVTETGRQFLFEEVQREHVEFSATISPRVAQLFDMGFFDTCIREACVQLEHEIKQEIKSTQYGDRLTESFIKSLRDGQQYLESEIRTFRTELRALFKFVRNEYMHNLFKADMITAYAILVRVGRIRTMLAKAPRT